MNMYPQSMQAPPPPYPNNLRMPEPYDQYFRPAEERMAEFEELVGRYESKFMLD